jgi:hypothetical protein
MMFYDANELSHGRGQSSELNGPYSVRSLGRPSEGRLFSRAQALTTAKSVL